MFWSTPSHAQPSPIEQILEKENYTLEELLDEEDLIQETKSLNGNLVEFLKQPATVSQLLHLIVTPSDHAQIKSSGSQQSLETKRTFKFPYVACEVFCCEVDAILSTLLESEELMAKLFSILDLPRPLDCVLAGYFSRVVHCLFTRKVEEGSRDTSKEVMTYLQTHSGVLERMISHVETTSVAEVLVCFLGADEANAGSLSPSNRAWMVENPVMEKLLEQLRPAATADSQRNAAYILSGIARSHFSPLAQSLASPQFLTRLFEFAFAENVSMLALDVCIALLEPKAAAAVQADDMQHSQQPPEEPSIGPQSELDAQMRVAAVKGIVCHLGRLGELLGGSAVANITMLTPFGVLAPPLGTARLKAVEVISALLSTSNAAANEAIVKTDLLRRCLDLFLEFPFNNLLHHLVTNVICFILESGSAEILLHVLNDCKLVQWLVEAPESVSPLQVNGSVSGRPTRAGYLGHLTHIANRLADAATVREPVAGALGAHPAWSDWVDKTLLSRNDTENVLMWDCGRPNKTRELASVSSVDELDAGNHVFQDLDDGDAANSRYSGFYDDFDDNDLYSASSSRNSWGMGDGPNAQNGVSLPWDSSQAHEAFRTPAATFADKPHLESSGKIGNEARVYSNDAVAAFRNLRLDSNLADDSSSSSSDDDATLRIPKNMGLDDDTVVVTSDSDEDLDVHHDTDISGGADSVLPSDTGFSDFADFGGFQPSDDRSTAPTGHSSEQGPPPSVNKVEGPDQELNPDSKRWNAFSDPTDAATPIPRRPEKERRRVTFCAGWAAFPDSNTAFQSFEPWAGLEQSSHVMSPSDKPETKGLEESQRGDPPPEAQEFSTFNYWRQPVHDLVDEYDVDLGSELAAGSEH